MKIKTLKHGDIIGIVCPSHVASSDRHQRIVATLESLGYGVKFGENVYKNTHGYLASEQERADDFNAMAADDSVRMILFGGGEGGNEILPLLDYESIKRNPKLICSFSDGTSVLNAIHFLTGVPVYYGQGPGMFYDLRYYDYQHFNANFSSEPVKPFLKNSEWKTLHGGNTEGTLIGGYLRNIALMLGNQYFCFDPQKTYILFFRGSRKVQRRCKG